MSAETLLSKLEGVRDRGHGRWLARCPAHEDRSPSLSLRETDDGTVLIRCFAGCGAADIVHAVGLELSDLFPRRTDHHQSPIRQRDRWNPRDLLVLLRREATVVMVAANDLRAGIALSDDDHQRLVEACGRISTVVAEVAS
ncbi:MAG: DNA primase [FCB group bacterium]|jgi:hypothetical protein|nr:DNA primase [FCB group bacterium]